jgi:hypothetical protein
MDSPSGQWWFTSLLTAFVGLLASFFEIYRRRVDKMQESYVSKEALQQLLNDMRDDRQRMHQENLEAQREIRGSVERVHERIDQIFSK